MLGRSEKYKEEYSAFVFFSPTRRNMLLLLYFIVVWGQGWVGWDGRSVGGFLGSRYMGRTVGCGGVNIFVFNIIIGVAISKTTSSFLLVLTKGMTCLFRIVVQWCDEQYYKNHLLGEILS